jgi:arsenite methyltransferase
VTDAGRPSGNYGIDRPLIAGLFALAIVAAGFFAVGGFLSSEPLAGVGPLIAVLFCAVGLAVVVRSGKVGKPALWDDLFEELNLSGEERVLDVGCGRGFVLVSAASRLKSGSAVGIDIWRSKDQSGNTKANCEKNLAAAGVADKAEVITADATSMPFGDSEFDVVLASLSLGAIPVGRHREQAVAEMVRVLRTGGRLVILDVRATDKIADLLEKAGLTDVDRSKAYYSMYPPARIVTAYKKAGKPKPSSRTGG